MFNNTCSACISHQVLISSFILGTKVVLTFNVDIEIVSCRLFVENNCTYFFCPIRRTGFEESKDLPIVLNSIIAGRYYVTEYLGSAAFSKVIQAHDMHTGIDVCLKIIKNDKDFFDQSLDEIKLLKFVNKNDPCDEHHILRLYDYFYHQVCLRKCLFF